MSNEYKNGIRQMVAYSHMNRFGELDEVYRKAQAFDQIIEISEECDNYMDFGDEIDAVIRSYKEDL